MEILTENKPNETEKEPEQYKLKVMGKINEECCHFESKRSNTNVVLLTERNTYILDSLRVTGKFNI